MKVRNTLASLALLCTAMVPAAFAQDKAPACSGTYNILRVSELKPGATAEQFLAAVSAHQAWYKSHGYPDVIAAARVVVTDPKTHADSISETQFITYHYSKEPVPPSKHDAAWDAYVKMYNDTSTIKEGYLNCVPAAAAPMLK